MQKPFFVYGKLYKQMKIITIHQPEHMPWLGFFNKMSQADVYILLDSVQFKTGNWQNRNRIVDKFGAPQWLTIPCLTTNHIKSTICDIEIDDAKDWRKKYKGRISDAYRDYPFYEVYYRDIFSIIDGGHTKIAEFNYDLIVYFRTLMGMTNKPELLKSSELLCAGKSTDLLIALIKKVGGDAYIAGADGVKYMEMEKFTENNIAVMFHHYQPFEYSALNRYQPCMSILDGLFSLGADELVRRDRESNNFGVDPSMPI
jgi:hypothetical protein